MTDTSSPKRGFGDTSSPCVVGGIDLDLLDLFVTACVDREIGERFGPLLGVGTKFSCGGGGPN